MNEEKPLPSAVDVEEEILGHLLTDSSDDCIDIIEKCSCEEFFSRSNRIVFSAIKTLHERGMSFDLIFLQTYLKDLGALEDAGGYARLSKLCCKFTMGFSALNGVDILKEKTRLRKLLQISNDIQSKAYQCEKSSETVSFIETHINGLNEDFLTGNLVDSASVKVKQMIQARKSGEKIYGIETGIKSFDDVFFGLQPSQYYAIAGRPSAGKTAFVDQVCLSLIRQAIPTLYIGLESSEERILGKIACKSAKISYTKFIQNKCNESELDSIDSRVDYISKAPFYLKRPMNMTSVDLRSLILREYRKNKIQVVIVDYIQKINGDSDDPRIGVMKASMQIQNICVETGITGLILCQMNRDAEKEKRPRMGHLKESGQIEQDADNICLLWGEKENHELEQGELKPVILTIEKNKDGIQGVDQKLYFERELMTFKERYKI